MSETYYDIRERYLNLNINGECVWVKKLRNILNSDIHEKPLGCKISDTHIKISKVHLDTFYEAQILFSHAHWVERFANELSSKIIAGGDEFKNSGKNKIVLIGYETYIEPVMYRLRGVLEKKLKDCAVEYCIYEEAKYTYLQDVKEPEIRYIETAFKEGETEEELKATQIVFICGISTTLKTYESMLEQLRKDLNKKIEKSNKWESLFYKRGEGTDDGQAQADVLRYFSIIQALPNNLKAEERVFEIEDKDDDKEWVEWNESEKWVIRHTVKRHDSKEEEKVIKVPYIVDVKCGWYRAATCEMCYPADVNNEKPIIETSETSVVPVQRILLNNTDKLKTGKGNKKDSDYAVEPLDFFKKDADGNFVFKDYLYYGHTVRGEHHFLYYIRTNHLFADIISDKAPKGYGVPGKSKTTARELFKKYCDDARENIDARIIKDKCDPADAVHIIVSPSHFSSKMFCNAINEFVFKSKAHVISFDPQKEYRSSFETKYSNYAYFLKQVVEAEEENKNEHKKKLYFYFVDDQIITGSSFYRMTSLIKNLFVKQKKDGVQKKGNNEQDDKNSEMFPESVRLWNGVFVVVSRNSKSTRRDYVDNIKAYYPLFNITVPSVRSYADSCPMCKMRADAENNVKKSVLDCNAHHWMEKVSWHKLNTLSEVKKRNENIEDIQLKDKLQSRRFRRFYCENELQKCLIGKGNGENIHDVLIKTVSDILQQNESRQCEYLISFVKALSRPFIYYREDVKPETLKILIGLTEGLLKSKELTGCGYQWGSKSIPLYGELISVAFNDKYEVYILLEILINCLASIDSTYLLHFNRNGKNINEVCKVAELYDFVGKILGDEAYKVLTFKPEALGNGKEKHSFFMVLLNAVKRIILGISGEFKSEKLEKMLVEAEANPVVDDFVKNFVAEKGKTSIYDFSLVQAIYLENSVKEKHFEAEIKNESDLTKKYWEIIRTLTDCSNKFKLQFLYYDCQLQEDKENGFDVFVIDKDATRESVVEDILKASEEKDIEIIKKDRLLDRLSDIGFYNHKNKFLIKLHGYSEKDIEEEKADVDKGKKKPSNEVYLLVDFGKDEQNIKNQLTVIRNIMQYRNSLTDIIRSDIDSGAIKSAVQATGSKRFLSARSLSTHGGVNDWLTLMDSIFENVVSDDNATREKGYNLLSVLMNEIISLGASCEILSEYFCGTDMRMAKNCFDSTTQPGKKTGKDIIKRYFIDKRQPSIFYDGKEYKLSDDEYVCGSELLSELSFKSYPKVFSLGESRPSDDDSIYQVLLLGLITIFMDNADKHGDKMDKVKVKKTVKINNDDNGYSISITNKKTMLTEGGSRYSSRLDPLKRKTDWDEAHGNQDESNSPKKGGFTDLFLTKFLPRLSNPSSNKPRYYINMGGNESGNYVATIYVFYEEDK